MLLRLKIVLFLFILCANILSAQTKFKKEFYLIDVSDKDSVLPYDKQLMDSLLNVYHKTSSDTTKFSVLKNLSDVLSDDRWWIQYNTILLKKTQFRQDSLGILFYGSALNNLGYESQYLKNDLPNALKYYEQSFTEMAKIGNLEGMGTAKNNMAYIFQHQGNIEKAIKYFNDGYACFEKKNYYAGMISILVNLGDIYFNNEDFQKAESVFKKALVYCKKAKNENLLANVYHQLSAIYKHDKKYIKALDYLNAAILIYEKQGNNNRLGIEYMIAADIYYNLNNLLKAEDYYKKALSVLPNATDLFVKSKVFNYVSGFYIAIKQTAVAKSYADSAYLYAKKIGFPELISDAATKLANYNRNHGDPLLAYDFLKEAMVMQDSINNDKIKKTILEEQYKTEFEKKEIQLKLEQDKKDSFAKERQQKQKLLFIIVLIALLATLVVIVFVYRGYSAKKKSTQILEEKNKIIYAQKHLVEEKQAEIISSINYAQRIQSAVLTGEEIWNKISKEHFIIFQPRDIVSGDFYWAHVLSNGRAVFALADCTGHGVPGGFMSMLGNSFLNELIVENKLFKADEILNRLRDKVIAALFQKGETQQKDGMDMALCVWNKMDNSLEFAGANNSLYLVRDKQLIEYKGDKMPIGTYLEENKKFSSQKISLLPNDIIYLSTDGFSDQFGGDKGKKFRSKQLEALLVEISTATIYEQKEVLTTSFALWKKQFEQTDDVSVIGIKII